MAKEPRAYDLESALHVAHVRGRTIDTLEARVRTLEVALRGAVDLIEQTEWLAFSLEDRRKLEASRAALDGGKEKG